MAMVSQDSDLFAMTLLENILYGLPDPENSENQDLVRSLLFLPSNQARTYPI